MKMKKENPEVAKGRSRIISVINGIAPLITYWHLAEILKILVIPLRKHMKKIFLIVLLAGFFILVNYSPVKAQCSICAKSVQQMGEKPARDLIQELFI